MRVLDPVSPGIVDAHVHFWNPRCTPWAATRLSRAYRFMPARVGDGIFGAVVPQADREFALTPRNVARIYEPAQYRRDAAGFASFCGTSVESVVYVESHWQAQVSAGVDEAHYASTLDFGTNGAPRLGAFIGHGDPRDHNLSAQLDVMAASAPSFRGIRLSGARHPDPKVRDFIDADSVLTAPEFLDGFARVNERGLVFETFVYSHQLYDVVVLAREYPDTTIVVDHMGAPVGAFGPVGSRTGTTAAARSDVLRLWRERTALLAQCRNVVMKLSGLAFPILGYGSQSSGNVGGLATLTSMVAPLVEHLLIHFGVDRLMFGSNYPIDKPNAGLDVIAAALGTIVEPQGNELLRKVFRENARRVYRF